MQTNKLWDSTIVFILIALCAAGLSFLFFRTAGEYAFLVFFLIWALGTWDSHKKIKRLRQENKEQSQRIKTLEIENTTLKKTAAIKKWLIANNN